MRTGHLNASMVAALSLAISFALTPALAKSNELSTLTQSVPCSPSERTSGCCGDNVDSHSKSKSDNSSVTDDYFSVYNDAFNLPEDGCDPIRYQQAKYLIETGRDFIRTAKPLHERVQEHILVAKTLKGRADMLMNKMPAVGSPKLQGAALKAAIDDYTKSLQAFVNNAEQYRFNLQTFKDTIGECQAAQASYDRQRQLYDLHCDQFHVQGFSQIEAPKICPQMDLTQGEAQHVAGELRADEQRLQQAMADINGRSQILMEANRLATGNIRNSTTQAVRLQEEEKLAKQFGRLREEYEFLNIQAKVLGVDKRKEAGKTIRQSVSGKVVNK